MHVIDYPYSNIDAGIAGLPVIKRCPRGLCVSGTILLDFLDAVDQGLLCTYPIDLRAFGGGGGGGGGSRGHLTAASVCSRYSGP